MKRKVSWAAALLGIAVATGMTLTGCSAPNGPPGPTGTLTGTLQAVGGPGVSPRPLTGQVTLHGSNGSSDSITSITVGAGGRFSIPVTVGTYTVTGLSPQYEGGNADCQASGAVTVTTGKASNVEVDCQEK